MFTNYMIDALKRCFLDWVTWHYSCQLVTTIAGFIIAIVAIIFIFVLVKKGDR